MLPSQATVWPKLYVTNWSQRFALSCGELVVVTTGPYSLHFRRVASAITKRRKYTNAISKAELYLAR